MTAKQAVALKAIRALIAAYGYPPTLLELSKRLRISEGAVRGRLAGLVLCGAIRIEPNTARGIVVAESKT